MTSDFVLDLPTRAAKPRQTGLTNLVDNGYGLGQLADTLAMTHEFVDVVKFGWASGYITRDLREKVELFRRYNIRSCPGGMFFELSYWQGKLDGFTGFLRELDIDMVEVSNGSLPIPEVEKCRLVEHFAKLGFTVLSEVGSKDVTMVSPPEVWVQSIKDDLNAGAWKVITEGRADASAGIYLPDGSIRMDIVDAILESGISADLLLFEAPHKRQMSWFVKRLGADVNIGNVPLGEVLNLETLRLGLRGDTVQHFHLEKRG